VQRAEDMELIARADPRLGVSLSDALAQRPQVAVDFSQPDSALPNALECLRAGVHVVVGTTGFDMEELARRSRAVAAERAADGDRPANAFVAPNFAIGAVLMMRFAAEASRYMAKAEIVELHHDGKLDAPSGTAARTAQLMAAASGHGEPPIHSVRLPGIVANQEVILGEVGQTLTIRHDTTGRESFMPGVLLAIRRVGALSESPVVGLERLLFEDDR
jgi:4-hydroxy-tetrahydrodipicolinate reductase